MPLLGDALVLCEKRGDSLPSTSNRASSRDCGPVMASAPAPRPASIIFCRASFISGLTAIMASIEIAKADGLLRNRSQRDRSISKMYGQRCARCGLRELPRLAHQTGRYPRTRTWRLLSIDHDLRRLRKLCPRSKLPFPDRTLPVTFSKALSPTFSNLMRKVRPGTALPSANL
jgi:hypothetical protein